MHRTVPVSVVDSWISGYLAGRIAEKNPVAILTIGGPGSGKSSVTHAYAGMVRVDPDQIKEMMPLYRALVACRAPNAAAIVHEESTRISERLLNAAVSARTSVLVDGTGKNLPKMINLIRRLKSIGYNVRLVYVEIDPQVAWERIRDREHVTGRSVPTEVVQEAYTKIPSNFAVLRNMVDYVSHFQNNGQEPKLVFNR